MLILTSSDSFAITSNISTLFQNISFQKRLCLIFLQTQEGPKIFFFPGRGLCRMFLRKLFLLQYYINWPNLINRTLYQLITSIQIIKMIVRIN